MSGRTENIEKNTRANARAVERWLEMDALYCSTGAPPDEPIQCFKGSSRSPATETAERFWDANREASRYIRWRVDELRRSGVRYGGVAFSEVLATLYGEPAIIQRWRSRGTKHDRSRHDALLKLCRLVADSIAAVNPDVRLVVTMSTRDEPVKDKQEAGMRDHIERKKDEKRERYEYLLGVMADPGVPMMAAYERTAKRFSVHPDTIRADRRFFEALEDRRRAG